MEEGGQVWLVSEGNGGLDTDLDATWGSLYSNSTRKYKHIVVILLMTDIPLSDQKMCFQQYGRHLLSHYEMCRLNDFSS